MLFATADLHFGHGNIIGYAGRPFADVDAMNEFLVDAWNDTVGPDDVVWVLGDVALGRLADTLPLVELLHGTKYLVPGNHDRCWNGHRKGPRDRERYWRAFTGIVDDREPFPIGGRSVAVSHFPYRGSGDHGPVERYSEHRPVDRGGWLIHGHVHERWRQRGRQINVGVDAWAGRPVSFDTLAELVTGGPADLPPAPWPKDTVGRL